MENKKIKLEDLNEAHFENARKIIEVVINNLTAKPDVSLILPVLSAINNFKSDEIDAEIGSGISDEIDTELEDGFHDGLSVGLRARLSVELHTGIYDGLCVGINDEIDDELYDEIERGVDTDTGTGIFNRLNVFNGLNTGLHAGIDAELDAGLHDRLSAGVDAGLNDEIDDELDTGLDAGLDYELYAGLYGGLRDGAHDGLSAALNAGLHDRLSARLHAGLDAEINAEIDNGISAGLHDRLSAGISAGIYNGLNAELDTELERVLDDGLDAGINAELNTELYAELKRMFDDRINKNKNLLEGLKLEYCGIYWSYWLIRYLIAYSFGCELDIKKIKLLLLFVNVCPIILKNKEGRIFAVKPTKIKWSISGYTKEPFKFPIYQLDADGESAVECLGFKLYYYKNLKLPEYIGKVKRKDWQPEWVLTEENQEIKRALLQEIEPEKLESVLGLKILDTYESKVSKYQLVEARNNPYPSRFRALKFECPTSKKPHLIRTHPDMTSAEAAVVEMNEGVHPDSFIWEC